MRSQTLLWRITGMIVILAAAIVLIREWRAAMRTNAGLTSALGDRDTFASAMMSLLENDPRARRSTTQQAVERVAALSRSVPEPTAAEYYARALRQYYGESNLDDAESAYRSAIEADPDWSWPYNGLGVLLYESGRHEEALELFEQAMELDPGWSRPYSDLAILYRLDGDLEKAAAMGKKALELEPDSAVTLNNYGVILDVQGKHDEARAHYNAALEADPDLPAPYYNLACGYARKGEAAPAVEFLSRAIGLDAAFREEPLRDADFDPIRRSESFLALVRP